MTYAIIGVVLLTLVGATAADPAEPPVSDDTTLDSVIVEARKLEALKLEVSTFVSSIALMSRDDSLARWQVPICPYVAGLPEERNEYVRQRLSQVAAAAGVPLGKQDCGANLVVVMTVEPEQFLRSWWRENPSLFSRERGIGAIERTIRTPAPVRVFYNACSVSPGSAKTFIMKGGPDCGTGMGGSRLTWDDVRVIYSVIVVVDLQKMEALTLGPLADYIAMHALAQLRKNADLGTAPTILRLFKETETTRPQGLSAWDKAFLKSLYDTDSTNVLQLTQIKQRMVQQIVP